MQIATREVCLWQNFLYGEDVEFADYTEIDDNGKEPEYGIFQ